MNISEELTRLAALRDQGVLTEAEFEAQKAALLSGKPAPATLPKKKTGVGKGCLIILGVLVVLVVLGAIIGGGKSGSAPASTAQPAASEPPMEVTAAEVASAYDDNEARAQATYGGHPLLVSATLAGIQMDFSDKPFLTLKTSGFVPANANLAEESQAEASQLSKGQKVRLLCQDVAEVVSIPQFKDCVIQ